MMDLSEKQRCLICNRGGRLLVCYDDGCPISVHKNCMGCEARFDDFGNFRCPYCLYRQLAAETCRLREKAILAKRALSAFLDEDMRDGNWRREPKTYKKEEISSTNKACLEKKNNMVSDDNQKQSIHLGKHQHSKSRLPYEKTRETYITRQTVVLPNSHGETSELNNGNACRIMVVYEAHSLPVDAGGVDRASFKENGMKTDQIEHKNGVAGDQQHATFMKEAQANSLVNSPSVEKQTNHQKRNDVEGLYNNGNRKKEDCMMDDRDIDRRNASNGLDIHTSSKKHRHLRHRPTHLTDPQETVNSSNSGELKDSSKQQSVIVRNTKLPPLIGKRRVLWSIEEEDMLKEGVQKYSTVNKNIPWRKVLEFGRHVFDASRNPSDLKDKWRKMAK